MKCNKKKNKNKDTVTRQDMIIVCLYIELFYLLSYYLGQYFFRRLGPLWNILKGIWDNSFSGILFIFQWIPAPGCFSFVLFLGLKAKKLFWASVFLEMWRDPRTPADSFYQIHLQCTCVPKTRFKSRYFFIDIFILKHIYLDF